MFTNIKLALVAAIVLSSMSAAFAAPPAPIAPKQINTGGWTNVPPDAQSNQFGF